MDPAAEKLVTEDEYVAMSNATDERLEYLAGQVFAMRRGTPRHNLISANGIAALATRLRGGPCRADTIVNPTVLIEVLSPSTEAYDRGEKFERVRLCAAASAPAARRRRP
jgi:Uma2 family endonuclease